MGPNVNSESEVPITYGNTSALIEQHDEGYSVKNKEKEMQSTNKRKRETFGNMFGNMQENDQRVRKTIRKMLCSNREQSEQINCTVKFDSGSEGCHGNWITPKMAEMLKVKYQQVEGVRFNTPIGDGIEVSQECSIQLFDQEWNSGFELVCSILKEEKLPEDFPYDVIVGEDAIEQHDLWLYMSGKYARYTGAEAPPEELWEYKLDQSRSGNKENENKMSLNEEEWN